METLEKIQSLAKQFQESASVRIVYGEPVHAQGCTVIPAARVAYGFGGGGGQGRNRQKEQAESGGGGAGGGVWAQPAGAIEISASGARWIDFAGWKKTLAALALGCAAGLVIGRIAAAPREHRSERGISLRSG